MKTLDKLKKKKNGTQSAALILTVVMIVNMLDLLFLYYLKYYNQNLGLSEFRMGNVGNLLNLIFTVLVITGTIVYSLRRRKNPNLNILVVFSILLTVILIAAAVSIRMKFPDSNKYILAYPVHEVITGFLFLFYQFIQFLFITLLWLNIFGGKELLILRAAVNSGIIVLILFIFTFLYLTAKQSPPRIDLKSKNESNIAVVLGAAVWSNNVASPSLAARTEKAAELMHQGYVGHIQLTGGNAPGELSEAEVAFNLIKNKNLDTTHIHIEKNTTSTSEQIEYIRKNFLYSSSFGNIVIVSDSYHLTRIKEICKFYNVKAEVVSSDLTFSFENNIYYKLRESIALVIFWLFAL